MQVIVRPVNIRQEHTEIAAFYAAHGKRYLPAPGIEALAAAAEEGRLYAAELQRASEAPRLVALAGVFAIADGGLPGQTTAVLELAGMVLDGAAVGGLNPDTLQDVLVWTRICGLLDEAGGGRLCLMSSVVSANAASVDSMRRCGLVPSSSPAWLRGDHRGWLGADASDIVDFVLDPAAVPEITRKFLRLLRAPILMRKNRTTGRREEFRLRFDLGWARVKRPALKAVANGNPPPWLGSIPEQRVIRVGDDEDDVLVQGP